MTKIFENLIRALEHNPEHQTELVLNGKTYNVCSRCLGSNSALLIFFVLFGLIYFLTDISFNFWTVFIVSWALAGLAIVDWGSAKLGLWSGDNRARIITGVTLGAGIMFYFWFLPVHWFFKIFSLFAYETVFTMIVASVHMKERGITLDDITNNILETAMNPGKVFCCSGCCSICCPISGAFMSSILPVCCCCLPCCLCTYLCSQGCGQGCGCDENMSDMCSMGK